MKKESSQLIFGDLIGGGLAVVGELANRTQVSVNRSLTEACQLEIVVHPAVEIAGEEFRCGRQ